MNTLYTIGAVIVSRVFGMIAKRAFSDRLYGYRYRLGNMAYYLRQGLERQATAAAGLQAAAGIVARLTRLNSADGFSVVEDWLRYFSEASNRRAYTALLLALRDCRECNCRTGRRDLGEAMTRLAGFISRDTLLAPGISLDSLAETYDLIEIDNGDYLPSTDVWYCDYCGEHHGEDTDAHEVYVVRGRTELWCGSGVESRSFWCSGSEHYWDSDEYQAHEHRGELYHEDYLPEDYHDDDDESRDDIADYHAGARKYYPTAPERLFGSELEIYFPSVDNRRAFCAEFFPAFPDWRAERDGSLAYSSAEIISPPLPLSAYRDGGEWPALCAMARAHGAQAWRHRNSHGLHVNVDTRDISRVDQGRVALPPDVIARFVAAVNNLAPISRRVAGRDHIFNASYCGHNKESALEVVQYRNKYAAVHVRDAFCSEVRIFGANLNPRGLLRAVEYCSAMLEWSTLDDAESLIYSDIAGAVESFRLFATDRGYSTLVDYITI